MDPNTFQAKLKEALNGMENNDERIQALKNPKLREFYLSSQFLENHSKVQKVLV